MWESFAPETKASNNNSASTACGGPLCVDGYVTVRALMECFQLSLDKEVCCLWVIDNRCYQS